LWSWGYNYEGQLGHYTNVGGYVSSPIQVIGNIVYDEIKIFWKWVSVRDVNGKMWVWGQNSYGQLGMSNTDSISSPTQMPYPNQYWRAVGLGYGNVFGVVGSANAPTATPEPTFAPTASATPAPTASRTPTPTASPAPTSTPAPTASRTPTPTASPVPTNTATPVPTQSPAPSSTPAPTASRTPTPTASPVPTNTATPAPTAPPPTASRTPTPTVTAAPATPTPTPSVTAAAPTATPAATSGGTRIVGGNDCFAPVAWPGFGSGNVYNPEINSWWSLPAGYATKVITATNWPGGLGTLINYWTYDDCLTLIGQAKSTWATGVTINTLTDAATSTTFVFQVTYSDNINMWIS
jgi:hypothetical protein